MGKNNLNMQLQDAYALYEVFGIITIFKNNKIIFEQEKGD